MGVPATYVVRVWLPDRPGALGAVAVRIGAVRGDVVGIDILERSGGQAVDELVVELPDDGLVSLLAAEIGQVDGVAVEDIRPVADDLHDPRFDALETAARLVEATTREELLAILCGQGCRTVGADWAVVADGTDADYLAETGTAPPAAWVAAFVAGSQSSAAGLEAESGPDDVVWAPLLQSNLALVMGRSRAAFRARERRHAAALARIADRRDVELNSSRHPVL